MTPSRPKAGLSVASTAALLIASAQPPLGSTLIAVALPSISDGIGSDLILVTGLLVTGYLVVNVVCQGPSGKISDLFGHTRVLWTGIGLYLVGALCGLVAGGVELLFLSRCLMAIAGALVVPATLALLRLHIPAGRRGRIFGLFGATQGIAAALGPALGGEIVGLFGWRAVFLANLPFLAITALLLVSFPLPLRPDQARHAPESFFQSVDLAGISLMALSLSLLILATSLDGTGFTLALLASAFAAACFLVWESRVRSPVFDLQLFTLPAFTAGTLIIALQNFAMYGLLFQLPQFFSVFLNAEARVIGYTLFVMMAGMVVAAPVGGYLTDRVGARRTALAGTLLLLIGLAQLWQLSGFDTPTDAVIALMVFGLGLGLCTAPAQAASMSAVDPNRAGMAAGVNATTRHFGGILSILVLGAVLGSEELVSASDHDRMIWLFTGAVLTSLLLTRGLPGVVTSPPASG